MSMQKQFLKLIMGLVLLVLSACAEEVVTEKVRTIPRLPGMQSGPFGVGVVTRTVPGIGSTVGRTSGTGAAAEAEVWYPADPQAAVEAGAAGRTPYTGMSGMEIRDLEPLHGYGRFPVLVFSHGLAGLRTQNPFQMQYLASRGYIIISVDHHPSTLFDIIGEGGNTDKAMGSALQRPLEVLAEIDALEQWNNDPQDWFFNLADTRRVVVIGHSFGGYTAFSVSGARGSLDTFLSECAADPNLYANFQCRLAREYAGENTEARYVDPRIVGVLPMTPGATPAFAGGFDEVVVPVLMMAGILDDVAPPALFQDWVWDVLPPGKGYARIANAGHNNFSQLCLAALPINCGTGDVQTALRVLHIINDLSAEFVDWRVRGEEAARLALSPEAVTTRWPGLDYRSDFGTAP